VMETQDKQMGLLLSRPDFKEQWEHFVKLQEKGQVTKVERVYIRKAAQVCGVTKEVRKAREREEQRLQAQSQQVTSPMGGGQRNIPDLRNTMNQGLPDLRNKLGPSQGGGFNNMGNNMGGGPMGGGNMGGNMGGPRNMGMGGNNFGGGNMGGNNFGGGNMGGGPMGGGNMGGPMGGGNMGGPMGGGNMGGPMGGGNFGGNMGGGGAPSPWQNQSGPAFNNAGGGSMFESNNMMGGPNNGGFGPSGRGEAPQPLFSQQARNGLSPGNRGMQNPRVAAARGGNINSEVAKKGFEKLNLEKASMMPPQEMLRYVQKCAHSYAAELDSRFPDCRKVMSKMVRTAIPDPRIDKDKPYVPCDLYNQDNSCMMGMIHIDAHANGRIHSCSLCYFAMAGMINHHRQNQCPLLSLLD